MIYLKLIFFGIFLIAVAVSLIGRDTLLIDIKHTLATISAVLVMLVPVGKIAFGFSFVLGLVAVFLTGMSASLLNMRGTEGKVFGFGFAAILGIMQLANYLLGFIIGTESHLAEGYLLLFDQPWLVVLITASFSLLVGLARSDDKPENDMAIFHPQV